jgi:hypothetical protein
MMSATGFRQQLKESTAAQILCAHITYTLCANTENDALNSLPLHGALPS